MIRAYVIYLHGASEWLPVSVPATVVFSYWGGQFDYAGKFWGHVVYRERA